VSHALLAFDAVSAGYAPDLLVVRDVALAAQPGEMLALVGPNGAGKSTILRLASRVLRPQQGRVLLDGRELQRLAAREVARQVAVVPQDTSLAFGLLARELVALGRTPHLRLLGGFGRQDREAVDWALEATGTTALADRFVDELSGGERQRVMVARALAQRPRVLLLDEPTANLDLHHQVASLDVIRGLAQEHGLAVLAALHDLQLAALYCDRVILLDQGQVVAQGSPEDVFTPSLLLATFGQPVAVAAHPTHGVPMVWLAPNGRARHRPQSLT